MPGLPFGHFFGRAMVKSDIRNDIDDDLAFELNDQSQHTVRAGVRRTEVQKDVIKVLIC
jgi:hypothetical protein